MCQMKYPSETKSVSRIVLILSCYLLRSALSHCQLFMGLGVITSYVEKEGKGYNCYSSGSQYDWEQIW